MSSTIYTNWNFDMSEAPKGNTVTRSMRTKDGQRDFQSYEPVIVILASECKKVIKSYWLPKEQRWAGFSETSRPFAWQVWPEWPEWPEAEIAHNEAFFARLGQDILGCGLCGEVIDGMGGPGNGVVCERCAVELRHGLLKGAVVWEASE